MWNDNDDVGWKDHPPQPQGQGHSYKPFPSNEGNKGGGGGAENEARGEGEGEGEGGGGGGGGGGIVARRVLLLVCLTLYLLALSPLYDVLVAFGNGEAYEAEEDKEIKCGEGEFLVWADDSKASSSSSKEETSASKKEATAEGMAAAAAAAARLAPALAATATDDDGSAAGGNNSSPLVQPPPPKPLLSSSSKGTEEKKEGGGHMILPNVLLAGAPKSGTTALSSWIYDGLGACRPRKSPSDKSPLKGVNFFKDDATSMESAPSLYAEHFRHCRDESLVMDASQKYLSLADEVRKTYEKAGGGRADDLRVIIILREPVATRLAEFNNKAYAYWRNKNRNQTASSGTKRWYDDVLNEHGDVMWFGRYINDWLDQNNDDIRGLRFGLYPRSLKRWMELFEHQRILVLAYDELEGRPSKAKERIAKFLGVEEPKGDIKRENTFESPHKVKLPPCYIQAKLVEAYEEYNEELYDLLKTKTKPGMEQEPFPRFQLSNCTTKDGVRAPWKVYKSKDF